MAQVILKRVLTRTILLIGTVFLLLGVPKPILGQAWLIQTLDSSGDVGRLAKIALGNDDYPHISYLDYTNDGLKHAIWTGTQWLIQTIDSGGIVDHSLDLTLDSSDFPHICYIYYDSQDTYLDMKYAQWTGLEWTVQTVFSDRTELDYLSLELDSNDSPYISWNYNTATQGSYLRCNTRLRGTGKLVDDGPWLGDYNSIALDGNGKPHISYYAQDDSYDPPYWSGLKYAEKTGNKWEIQRVEENVGMYTSIAIDSIGHPHISYYDWTYGDLKHARWTGFNWEISIVDSTGDVGMYTSIVLDGSDYPHISYYDSTNGDLKYAYWTGAFWEVQTVDSSGNVGMYTSIALDSQSIPHISYYDGSNGDLKYAYFSYDTFPEMNVKFRDINFIDGSISNFGTRTSSLIMGREFTFTIENLGAVQLNLTGSPMVALSGPQAEHFYISQQPTSPVEAYGATTFKIRTVRDSLPGFLPVGWTYPVSITVNIPNDDADENPYDFTINFTLKKDS